MGKGGVIKMTGGMTGAVMRRTFRRGKKGVGEDRISLEGKAHVESFL